MSESTSKIRADFDRIASLDDAPSGSGWSHNSHYHGFLLQQIPSRCTSALDVGCGTGAFSRLLAGRCERVLALDLSPRMIGSARERSKAYPNIDFQIGDAMKWAFPDEGFDCIASIATLHHLPLDAALRRIKRALQPGGVLLVLDLYQEQGLGDLLTSMLAVPANAVFKLVKTGRLREPPAVRKAWAEHGRNDTYLPLPQIRQTCADVLPGVHVRKHLFWRYSIVWKKKG